MANPQPTLPAEGTYTDIERLFIAEEPPGLLPSNQNSNWGLFRRVISDELQEAVDELSALFSESFIDTASAYLSDWEVQMGLPISTNQTDAHRRSVLKSRRTRAPFTRSRIAALIESYVGDTFGAPTEFGAGGIGLSAGGTTLYGESAAVGTLYRVYEDIRNFAYAVWIKNTVTPDIASLTRELKWITPAHITMTLDNTKANILDYMRTVLNLQPAGFWRLNDLTDSSGNANGLTANGGITAGGVASPGLLVATGNSDNAATLFDGVDDYLVSNTSAPISAEGRLFFSVGAWIKTATANKYILAKPKSSSSEYALFLDAAGHVVFQTGNQVFDYRSVTSSTTVTDNVAHHVVGVFDLARGVQEIYIDKVLRGSISVTAPIWAGGFTSPLSIGKYSGGGVDNFNGTIDEVAVYDHALTLAEISRVYDTGKNIA
jgi:hypothetical protein